MTVPRFSVIVPAHDRRQFLESAVDSIRAQTLPSDRYEIVVVKNFTDEELDRRLTDRGARVLFTPAAPLGVKLATALGACSGEIITFLEDDDLYRPDRLALIDERFRDPGLGFYHNAVQLVDGLGYPVHSAFRRESERAMELRASDRSRSSLRRFLGMSPYFNLSSIAVRRGLLAPVGPYLARVNLTCDNLVFYAALGGPLALANDPRRLTYYRLHRSASWGNGEALPLLAREELLARSEVEGFSVIAEMIGEHPARDFVLGDLWERRARRTLASTDPNVRFSLREAAHLFAARRLRAGYSTGLLLLGLGLRGLTPSAERRLYATYLTWRHTSWGLG